MSTRELLEHYQQLVEYGNQDVIDQFVEENQENKRFVSLVELRNEFLDRVFEMFVE